MSNTEYAILPRETAIEMYGICGDHLWTLLMAQDYHKAAAVAQVRSLIARELGMGTASGKPPDYPERILWLRNPRGFRRLEIELPSTDEPILVEFDPSRISPVIRDTRRYDLFVMASRGREAFGVLRLGTGQFQSIMGNGLQIYEQGLKFEAADASDGEVPLGYHRMY